MGAARFGPGALALLLCVTMAAESIADEEEGAKDGEEEIEEIEDVEVVEVVQAVSSHSAAAAADQGFTVMSVYGRLHPAFAHLPIGFLLLLVVLEVFYQLRPSDGASKLTMVALVATFFSAMPSLLSGFLRAYEMWHATEPPDLLADHRALMFAMTGVIGVALVLRFAKRKSFTGGARYTYLVLLFAAAVLAAVGGHMGGKLVFGARHLPF